MFVLNAPAPPTSPPYYKKWETAQRSENEHFKCVVTGRLVEPLELKSKHFLFGLNKSAVGLFEQSQDSSNEALRRCAVCTRRHLN